MDDAEAVVRVTLYAMENPQFRREWDLAVRAAADVVCAQVAGARMAGRTEGDLAVAFGLPVPPGMDPADAARAFRHQVSAVASERIGRMKSPGGPG